MMKQIRKYKYANTNKQIQMQLHECETNKTFKFLNLLKDIWYLNPIAMGEQWASKQIGDKKKKKGWTYIKNREREGGRGGR